MNNIKIKVSEPGKCSCLKCQAGNGWKIVGYTYETVGMHLYKVLTLKMGNAERKIRQKVR